MAISFIGSATAESTGVTPPTHQAGDLFVCYAYTDGSTSAPFLPFGWTNVNFSGSSSNAFRLGWKIAGSSADTCTGWTGASGVILHVYRGAQQANGSSASSGIATTVTYPGSSSGTGTSWFASFLGHRSANATSASTAPPGMTNRSVRVGSVCTLASHDTNAVLGSVTGGNVNIGGSSSGFMAVTTEILSIPQPALYDPNVGYVSNTSCEPSVTVSYGTGSGTLYMVAVPFGDTPSVAQIKAGQRSNGTPAIASQNQTVTSDGTNTFSPVTGLTLGTEYYFWFLQSNGGGDSTPVLATYTPQNYIAQSTSWLSPGSTGADGSYGATFTNHANLKVEDGSYASTTLGASKGAIAFTYNFNANLPAGAVVNGIEVRIKGMMPVTDAAVLTQAYLAVDASSVSNPIASSSNVFAPELTTTNTAFVGGSTSGWATTYWGGFGEYGKPNATAVNNSTFGVVVTGYNIGATSRTINLDLVQMKVHYLVASTAPSNPTPVLFWAFP